jgi:Zn-dependent M28 family amino/carboxypeptidase
MDLIKETAFSIQIKAHMPSNFFKTFMLLSLLTVPFILTGQINELQLFKDLEILSSDEYGGRPSGDNEKARTYIIEQLKDIAPAYSEKVDTFGFQDYLKKVRTGYNVVGKVVGTQYPDHYIVLSAHYDHLGIRKDSIYNGADDNASGTAALLALARYFKENPPRHSFIFAFFDAEELGLKGADRFVEDPPFNRDQILMNINMDMVGRNDENTINICGTYDFPKLNRPIKRIIKKSPLNITKKHEGPGFEGADNWTMSSDHGKFLARGIPYLYFGVEDHPGYHRPSDDFEFINLEFFQEVTNLIKDTAMRFDRKLKVNRIGN